MATALIPVYSVYTDTRNGYSVGIHKIRLNTEQIKTTDTYTWDVVRLAPSASWVGGHLSVKNQFPHVSAPTNAGGSNRNTVSVYITSTFANTVYANSKNSDGTLDLIFATLHVGAINNSVRTA